MRKIFTSSAILLIVILSFAVKADTAGSDPNEVRFIKNNKEVLNMQKQQLLLQSTAWNQFVQTHQGWKAIFDERSSMPHRAYGAGVMLVGNTPEERALNFINNSISSFGVPVNDIVHQSTVVSKYDYVDYYQVYGGLEVLNSRVTVRMTLDGKIVLFGADVFNNINVSTIPSISVAQAHTLAAAGIGYTINQIDVQPELKILPVPVTDGYEFHLVYEAMVNAVDAYGIPYRYYTLVDAHDGTVLYRQNRIEHSADVNVKGTVAVDPTVPNQILNIPDVQVKVSGTSYYTDANGNVTISSVNGSTTAITYVQGLYCKVLKTGNNANSFNSTISTGSNNVSFDGTNISPEEISAYYDVSTEHDFMKVYWPTYTGLDNPMTTNVDVAGSCNSYYDGTVNIYAAGGGCPNMAFINTVPFHEYGHGISHHYYDDNGHNFNNGAMDEGYADTWATGITDQPVIGKGFYVGSSDGIREYQNSIKVYPQDIQGEVHADGEIIAGAWWWTNYLIGDMNTRMNIFTESYNGFASGPDGTEGTVYRDILLDALDADDDNGNINDGTPHDAAIIQAFALHGITLAGIITIDHIEPQILPADQTNTISATVSVDYPIYFGGIQMFFKKDIDAAYDSVGMTASGNTYSATVPAYPKGTILDYYFKAIDVYGYAANIKPSNILQADPNLPYKLLIGFEMKQIEDFDNFEGLWVTGVSSDQNQTGTWTIDSPIPSYITPGVSSSMVQTSTDHTPGANYNLCAFTGNASSANSGAGDNDVDEGATTLISPTFDLSNYTIPAISYWRWFSNDQGAAPGNDPLRVYISNDGGSSWTDIEDTYTADHSWRDNAFRVADYVTPTSTIVMKFVASDSSANAQSLVEAAIDDLKLWDEATEIGINETTTSTLNIYPNPADNILYLQFSDPVSNGRVEIYNVLGKIVLNEQLPDGAKSYDVSTKQFSQGNYLVKIFSSSGITERKLTIIH